MIIACLWAVVLVPTSEASPSPAPATARQLITVQTAGSSSTSGTLSAWEKDGMDEWVRVLGPVSVLVGAGGVGQASEKVAKTPAGTFMLTESFGRQPNPGTVMPYFKTDSQDWWNGNSNSPQYNTHVRQSASPGGASENLLAAGAVYDYAVNIGFNLGRTPGAGSAFFLHVTNGRPTAGCVAIDRTSMIWLLNWLNPAKNPTIDIRVGPEWLPDPAESSHNPIGDLNNLTSAATPSTLTLNGWAFDPDSDEPTMLHIYDSRPDGTVSGHAYLADVLRPDVAAAYGVSALHGFAITLNAPGAGLHRICVYAINVGRGTTNPEVGCREITVPNPVGNVDSVANLNSGEIVVSGWGADPSDAGAEVAVHVYVVGPSGTFSTATSTTTLRPDVMAAISWAGLHQGFRVSVPTMGAGQNRVCAYAINVVAPHNNPSLGCRDVLVQNATGSFDGISVNGDGIQVSGWALNPNNESERVQIHIYDSGPLGIRSYGGIMADQSRPDVAAAFSGVDAKHGFASNVPLVGTGSHRVCLYAISTAGGNNNPQIGCRSITVG